MANASNSRKLLYIPLGIGLLFALLYFIPAWRDAENGMYDLFLQLKPEVEIDPNLVLLDIDDTAIDKVGTFPWPRSFMAEGLETLYEFNADTAIFDIEYLNPSPSSVDTQYLDFNLKQEFATQFNDLQGAVFDVIQSYVNGKISRGYIQEVTKELGEYIVQINNDLYEKTRKVAQENDSYLAGALEFFGNSYLTLNLQESKVDTVSDALRAVAAERFAYPRATLRTGEKLSSPDFLVPLEELSIRASGAGFTNVEIDKDGKRRRIQLVQEVGGKLYLQLAFLPLMKNWGSPELFVEDRQIVVKGAVVNGQTRDFTIPLVDGGMMLLNWPKRSYLDSYRHVSFYKLVVYRGTEVKLGYILSNLALDLGALFPGNTELNQALDAWQAVEELRKEILASGGEISPEDYRSAKNQYYTILDELAKSDLDQRILAALEAQKTKSSNEMLQEIDTFGKKISTDLAGIRTTIATLQSYREELAKELGGATCVIGWTASASTDFGTTPFEERYANPGTHTTVLNTIIQGSFLTFAPWWFAGLLTIVLSLGLIVLVRRLKTGMQIVLGVGTTLVIFVGIFVVFSLTGVYIPALSPLIGSLVSFLTFFLVVFFLSEKEKSFLRKAFSTYLSGDVIAEMVNNPAMLKLGGQKKWISAMFTDVRGFSSISEVLEPEQLVRLLNEYLSAMSDLILDNRGTIDKFEGDAIISFFGAPVSYETHAESICRAAVLMKRKEKELNVRFLAEKMTPHPLLTRIGINTGDMVVGNMGTEKKMDYTIMGNAVNLAARLEGVNKQYGSWILATDATRDETGDIFAWRMLDRVRVVGINKPVRLYELLGIKGELEAGMETLLEDFSRAFELYENRSWAEAGVLFADLQKRYPEDGPTKTYLKRCLEFKEKPPAPEWEGVFNLTEK